jgi:hypothetical protein
MKCKRCNCQKIPHERVCPVCSAGLSTEIKQLRIVVDKQHNNYSQTITIYATEFDGKEHKVGKLTDFYTSIWLLVRLLRQYNNIVIVEGDLLYGPDRDNTIGREILNKTLHRSACL